MKLQQAIDRVDVLKPNMQDRSLKIAWLSELDGLIWQELILKHEYDGELETMPVYDEDTDPEQKLIVPAPYDNVYTYWLMAKIDEQNMELDKYNNDRTMFTASYESFSDFWTRTHMPKTRIRELMI